MSSELVESAMHSIDDEAYEVPTYDEAFPPMAPGAGDAPRAGGVSPPVNTWHTKMLVRSSTVTQVCFGHHIRVNICAYPNDFCSRFEISFKVI